MDLWFQFRLHTHPIVPLISESLCYVKQTGEALSQGSKFPKHLECFFACSKKYSKQKALKKVLKKHSKTFFFLTFFEGLFDSSKKCVTFWSNYLRAKKSGYTLLSAFLSGFSFLSFFEHSRNHSRYFGNFMSQRSI